MILYEAGGMWVPDDGALDERGCYQLHPVHKARAARLGYDWADMFDPLANGVVAYDLWKDQGWAPWEAQRGRCW